jgi:hypothetical protein
MALAWKRGSGFPIVLENPIGQAVADDVDGGLKTLEIIPGSHTDHTTAIRFWKKEADLLKDGF